LPSRPQDCTRLISTAAAAFPRLTFHVIKPADPADHLV
jgi:hypothetical protein